MKYPSLDIYIDKIRENAVRLQKELSEQGVKLTAVVKGFAGDLKVFSAYQQAGIVSIADSRIENIKHFRAAGYPGEIIMLRIPMPSEIAELTSYIDGSLISESRTAELFSLQAEKLGKVIDLIIMVDLGDRREGVLAADLPALAYKIEKLPGVNLKGIGTNLGCFAGIIPDLENSQQLIRLKKDLERELGRDLAILSAGNTATIKVLTEAQLTGEINNLRVGEAILLGSDIINQRLLTGYNHYNFRLKAEIIELKEKPSRPEGEMAFGGQGRDQHLEDKGWRKRAILAVGKQDIDYQGLYPEAAGIEVLGASSDHLITDITEMEGQEELSVGDVLTFKMNYSAMLRAMTSAYISKNYL